MGFAQNPAPTQKVGRLPKKSIGDVEIRCRVSEVTAGCRTHHGPPPTFYTNEWNLR